MPKLYDLYTPDGQQNFQATIAITVYYVSLELFKLLNLCITVYVTFKKCIKFFYTDKQISLIVISDWPSTKGIYLAVQRCFDNNC